ncbi:MAG: AAA family ATPase, partial [Lentisphaerae bacterium]|nr:AAA family ATPase [Lentisphaerota bacterium]
MSGDADPSQSGASSPVRRYTASGARRTGDEYQDLQSAEILVGWLEDTSRFKWVRLEAMDGSLDDIQAKFSDDSLTLLQVKFGVDPENEWTWNEFTKREASKRKKKDGDPPPRKPSLLMKWASSLSDARTRGEVRSAALLTNRTCSDETRDAIGADGRVDLSKLTESTRETVIPQLGGESAAIAFFSTFQFRFEIPSPDALADGVFARFHRLGGTQEGWYRLLDSVKRWINLQDEPRAGGHILLSDLRAAARWHQPPTIPQGFFIPADFVPPERWSTRNVEPLIFDDQPSEVVVVTGSPGIGKSTYISWFVERLGEKDVAVVRHHFFLSLEDKTQRRTAWQTAADAIIGQLLSDHHELLSGVDGRNPTPDRLREFLEAAASSNSGGAPLVVVVDGLDHVWRETGTSEDLNRLFDMLLPVPDGMVLVVGTQSVDSDRLPAKLRQAAPRDLWQQVPVLDLERVRTWLRHHLVDLSLPEHEDHAARIADEVADALHTVSAGHPLVLHYVYNAARHQGLPVVAENVRTAPSFDPASDMAGYYKRLWEQLSPLG